MGDAKEIRNIRQAMRRFDEKHGTKHTFREKHHALAVSAVQRKEKRGGYISNHPPVNCGTITCKNCGIEKAFHQFSAHRNMLNGRLSVCRKCKSKYAKQWFKERGYAFRTKERVRKYKATSRERFPKKLKARSALSVALKSKKLVRPSTCTSCGLKGKIHGHHNDYSKPLEVVWLCMDCHTQLHKGVE